MMRFWKRAAVLTAVGAFAITGVTGCSGTLDSDAVVATVGGEDITLGVANFYARMQQGMYETYYAGLMGTTAEDMWTQEYDGDSTFEQYTKEGLLETLENMYILSQHAADYDVSLTDDEKESIESAASNFSNDNTEESKEVVTGYQKNIEKFLELATIQTKMESAMKEGVDEEVSDDEAAQKSMDYVFFSYTTTDDSGNSTELTDDEKEALKTTAQDLADQVSGGEDFASAAENAGAEVQTATFDADSTSPDADLIAAADALENEGDVTAPVETDSGVYVAQLTSLLDREATDAEKENIVEQRRQDQYDSLLEDWREDAAIDVNERVWDKVDFIDQGITLISSEDEESSASDDTAETEQNEDASSEDGSGAESGTEENAE